jgi:hypothetical protein
MKSREQADGAVLADVTHVSCPSLQGDRMQPLIRVVPEAGTLTRQAHRELTGFWGER